ncbi:hypothetical protein [Thiomonas sp. FB-Cd]|uniref:hypothetical protein n=1 Tax=Thiomonas sp. FB-Cd TaxID=1158292 RepID=UPI000ADE5ED5|nr:hypothetical protein [Thiomonas sp. FB-Cd]
MAFAPSEMPEHATKQAIFQVFSFETEKARTITAQVEKECALKCAFNNLHLF